MKASLFGKKAFFWCNLQEKKTGEKYRTDQQVKHAQTCTSTRHAPAPDMHQHTLDGANNNKNVIWKYHPLFLQSFWTIPCQVI